MNLYNIVFTDGTSTQEYGTSKQDVSSFISSVYTAKIVESICLTP